MLTPTPVEVTIVGIATFGDVDSLGPTTYTAFTLPQATELFAQRPDTISSVLVAAEDGVSQETLRQEITEQLPARIEALTQAELTAEQNDEIGADFLDMFSMILLAFAGIALVVATFSIHNTFSILVAQRTRESALLRAIGASRRQVVTAVGIEALVIGVDRLGDRLRRRHRPGHRARRPDGRRRARPARRPASSSAAARSSPPPSSASLTTLVASIAPAIKASRVAPLAALRDVAVDRSGASKVRAVAGVVIAGAGALAVVTATSSPTARWPGPVSAPSPCSSASSSSGRSWPARRPPCSGSAPARPVGSRVAWPGATRCATPGASPAAPAALMVGTAVVALFTTFGSSVKASIDDMVDDNFGGDLVIVQDDFSGAGIDPAVAPAIGELPEVAGSVGSSVAVARIGDTTVEPMATDPAALAAVLDLDDRAGRLADVGPGELAVSTRWAADNDVAAR